VSDGLFAPQNAPAGQPAPVGIQPGSSGIVPAQIVIVYGPGPAIYVYSGTPALGNLIGSWAGAAGTDPFGNATQANFTVYGPSGSYINITSLGGINPVIQLRPENVTHANVIPQANGNAVNAGGAAEQEELFLSSGKAGGDDMAIQLYSESADLTTAMATYLLEAGGTILHTVNKLITNIATPITATAGTTSAPTNIVSDTWHQATSFNNGWTAQNAGFWYRLTNDKELEILGDLSGGPAGNSSIITFSGIYVPNLSQNHPAGQNNPGGTSPPWISMGSNGVLAAIGVPVAGEEIFFHIFVPVNLVNGGFG
jgi:hypothetical protein